MKKEKEKITKNIGMAIFLVVLTLIVAIGGLYYIIVDVFGAAYHL